jgi:AAA family ATP:ADP antiporter
MRVSLSQLLNIKSGEWKLVLSLFFLLAINTLVLELSDVVAMAGFISNIGVSGILWLWVADMIITLLAVGGYALAVDRVPRVRLMAWLLGGLAVIYLILQLLFGYRAPDWLTYPSLYIIADLQSAIFPLTLWTLANDVYTMSEGKRLFPIIGAGFAVGSVLGNGLAAGSAVLAPDPSRNVSSLLALMAVILLSGILLLWYAFRNRTVRARQARETGINVRETAQVGVDFFKNVPLFGYLAIAMLLAGLSLTVVEYHFFFTAEQSVANSLQFQAFYGTYKMALILTILLSQWLVAGRLLRRVPIKSTFLALPAALVVAVGLLLAAPGLMGAAAGRFLARWMQRAWDELARKALQGLVPDERRGRISTIMDSYFYTVATMIGCLILGGLLLAAGLGWLPDGTVVTIYLLVAALAAIGAVWASLHVRSVYDKSLLDWRLARSRRKSMLDGIEF